MGKENNHLRNNRSASAAILEKVLKNVIIPKGSTITEVMLEYRKFKGRQKKYSLPVFLMMQSSIEAIKVENMQLFYINVESKSRELIIYLHGGAYVNEMLPFHWLMLDKLAKKLDCTFIIPDYPLAPIHSFEESYDKLTILYQKVIRYYPDRKIVLMGDSAGGGLALGLSMYWATLKLPQPKQLILLSPWVDLTMSNTDMADYEAVDPLLRKNELIVDAYYWADGADLKDCRLSPIYGDFTELKQVVLFTGTHEIFYPDITLLFEKLKAADVDAELNVGEGLNHVYPAFPIPEADAALQHITELIKGDS